jgi:hypothetical protein
VRGWGGLSDTFHRDCGLSYDRQGGPGIGLVLSQIAEAHGGSRMKRTAPSGRNTSAAALPV